MRDYAFGMWWTDLFGGTYHDDKIIDLLAQLKSIDNRYLGSAGAGALRMRAITALTGVTTMKHAAAATYRNDTRVLKKSTTGLARIRCHGGAVSRDRLPVINPLTANAVSSLDQFGAGVFPVLDHDDDPSVEFSL